MRRTKYSAPLLAAGGVAVALTACSAEQPTPRVESLEPLERRTTSAPLGAPALRVDGRVFGLIVSYETKTGRELDMEPGDLVIYVIRLRVERSEHDRVRSGKTLTLYSKLSLDQRLREAPGWVQVATESTRPAWLISYE